eukprot:6087790-Amphidinium_carterae.1
MLTPPSVELTPRFTPRSQMRRNPRRVSETVLTLVLTAGPRSLRSPHASWTCSMCVMIPSRITPLWHTTSVLCAIFWLTG